VFVGSFAVGMDGAILAARNDWRQRWRLGNATGGYPLYLLSCAVNLTRHRAAPGRVRADGTLYEGPIYNLLAANTALYAGEFRFAAEDHSDDGRLDLQIFTGPADYVRAFVAAWRRHLRSQRGGAVADPARIQRVTRIEIDLARPVASQLDGEEDARAAHYEIEVLPHAIRMCVPPGTAGGPPAS
jgi:diacylglycerol kinase family enzyme